MGKRWVPLLGVIQLGALSKAYIRQALVKLSESGGEAGKPLAPAPVIEAYACIATAIKWAHKNDIIPTNPCEGVRLPVGRGTEKGILTDQEIADLFALEWQDRRGKVAFLVGATTGSLFDMLGMTTTGSNPLRTAKSGKALCALSLGTPC